jgi:hypothetical protein
MKIQIDSRLMVALPLVSDRGKIKLSERSRSARLGEALEKVNA